MVHLQNARSLEDWVGSCEQNEDIIDLRQVGLMQTIIGGGKAKKVGEELPLLWHWLYFPTRATLDELGIDGHPKLGGFLPPVKLPRRMWAGGRLQFLQPLKIGDEVVKKSTVQSIKSKTGKSGELCFVTVVHEFSVFDTLCLIEEHDIVYRENSKPGFVPPVAPPAPAIFDWKRNIEPSPVMLFRYSALTFNGHRIHYDGDYCRDVEGLEGLVFHGPLTATLLADLAVLNNPGKRALGFDFRAVSPLYDGPPFVIAGANDEEISNLWAQNPDGRLAMSGQMTFTSPKAL